MTKTAICVIDTGTFPHIDLVVPYYRIICFIDLVNGKTNPYDDNGHGSFVSGLCVGNGLMSGGGIKSIASRNNIVSIKAIDKCGIAPMCLIIKALHIVEQIHIRYNIGVIVLCCGLDSDTAQCKALHNIIKRLYDLNITIVVSSGNDGNGSLRIPATYDEVIAVGSVDNSGNISLFTSILGDKPNFYAQGEDVYGISHTGYTKMTGTSMSAPYVASIVAAIKDNVANITHEGINDILKGLAANINGRYIL